MEIRAHSLTKDSGCDFLRFAYIVEVGKGNPKVPKQYFNGNKRMQTASVLRFTHAYLTLACASMPRLQHGRAAGAAPPPPI